MIRSSNTFHTCKRFPANYMTQNTKAGIEGFQFQWLFPATVSMSHTQGGKLPTVKNC